MDKGEALFELSMTRLKLVLVDSDSALPKDQERAAGASSIGAGSGSQSQASTAADCPMGSKPTRGQRSLALSKPRPWRSLNSRDYHEETRWCCCWWSDSPEVEVPAGSLGMLCRVPYGRGASFVNCRAVAAVAAVLLWSYKYRSGRPWAELIALAKTQ
jgi:hypothetical protein